MDVVQQEQEMRHLPEQLSPSPLSCLGPITCQGHLGHPPGQTLGVSLTGLTQLDPSSALGGDHL